MVKLRFPKSIILGSAVGTAIGGLVLFKEFVGGGKLDSKVRLDGKTVIITGANTGIGKETARELAKRGAKVIMACRDMPRCQEARKEIVLDSKNKYVYCKKCDLTSLASVNAFANEVIQENDSLHILINNAGVMRCPKTLTADGFEMQFGVNHLGHFYLTNLLLNKFKSSCPSRIINVSSVAHKKGHINFADLNSSNSYDPAEAYNQSKLANVLFTKELARKLQGTGVTTYAVHPGIVNTEITRHMGFAKSTFSGILLRPLMWIFIKSPRQGAQTTLYCALDDGLASESGKYYSNCKEAAPLAEADDPAIAARLWAISEKWTLNR